MNDNFIAVSLLQDAAKVISRAVGIANIDIESLENLPESIALLIKSKQRGFGNLELIKYFL